MLQLDERDSQILAIRQALWDEVPGPRVGDRVVLPSGEIRRIAHLWAEDFQPTTGPGEGMSFYMFGTGMSYSGGLDRAIPLSALSQVDTVAAASVWFFHHHDVKAHNGVMAFAKVRTFRVEEQNA